MFRLTHISDTHGMIPHVPRSSLIVVHSGDMAPNHTRGIQKEEEKYQEEWWNNPLVLGELCERIGDAIFAFIPGNHDYFDPEAVLRRTGIKAVNISNSTHKICGVKFYGFPYIPYIQGEWNYELRHEEMSALVANIDSDIDVLVAHCPPFGVCAEASEGKAGGNSALLNHYNYTAEKLPSYLLCGHFHESRGIGKLGDMIVSNAATVQHTFEMSL